MTNQTTRHTRLGYASSECGLLTFEMMQCDTAVFLALQKAKEGGGGVLERC